MDVVEAVRQAWRMTWRNPFLWLLALFAGGAVGALGRGSVQWRPDAASVRGVAPGLERTGAGIVAWLVAHPAPAIGLAIVLVALAVAALAVSFVAQGGMARATADLALGRASSLAVAWRAGRRTVWRYVGLWCVLAAVAFCAAALIALLVVVAVVAVMAVRATEAPPLALVAAGLLVGLPLAVGVLAAAVAASIVVAYAQRAIAVEDVDALAALAAGWRLLRGHPVESILVWIVNLILAAVTAMAVFLAAAVVGLVLGGVGFAMAGLAPSAVVLAYALVAGAALLLAFGLAVAVANTFFWSYWTIAYLRLSGRGAAA